MQAHTSDKNLTAMSRFTESGLNKKVPFYCWVDRESFPVVKWMAKPVHYLTTWRLLENDCISNHLTTVPLYSICRAGTRIPEYGEWSGLGIECQRQNAISLSSKQGRGKSGAGGSLSTFDFPTCIWGVGGHGYAPLNPPLPFISLSLSHLILLAQRYFE